MATTQSRRAPPPVPDKLDQVRAVMREARDLELSIHELEQRLSAEKEQLRRLQHEVLPDIYTEAGVRSLTIDPQGNLPAFTGKLSPYYRASIPVTWEEERQAEAFQALREAGGEDLIKNTIIVELERGDTRTAERIEDGLRRLGVNFTRRLSVHHKTLTSFVQEQYEHDPPRPLPLEKLGAVVGRRVSLKPESKIWQRRQQ